VPTKNHYVFTKQEVLSEEKTREKIPHVNVLQFVILPVYFRCEEAVSSYCGGRIEAVDVIAADVTAATAAGTANGYLSSPGYPKYYLGGRECVWSIQAASGQTVSLQLWDISTQV
jgi:CUB domain